MPRLDLVPIYLADRTGLLDGLSRELQRVFGLETRVRPPTFDPEISFDVSRGQYNSTLFLKQLLTEADDDDSKILGITGADLFVPVLTYVFGEAQLDGRAAVVSVHRLRTEVYGLPSDPGLLRERLATEAIHELGHAYGLLHCPGSECVMHPSTYVEEIDLKTPHFCDACAESIQVTRGCDGENEQWEFSRTRCGNPPTGRRRA